MNYLRAIDRSKVMFDFVVHREQRGEYEDEIERLGGRIYRLPELRVGNMVEYRKAVIELFDSNPQYTMIHGHCSELGYFIYREAHKRGFKFIAAHAHNYPKGFDLKTPVRNVLKHLIRPHLTHYFTCGKESAKWLFGKRLAEKAIFLPNAIDAQVFAFDNDERDKVRCMYGWENRMVVGNVSRFSYQKNHIFLIDIFAEILRREPSALLVLIGSGGDMEQRVREKIEKLGIGNNVSFMGSRSDIAELLQGIDVFVFPSHFEGLSVAQLEAQAAGLKIINSTGIPKEGTVIEELVDSLSLNLSAGEWAEKIVYATKHHKRRNTYQEITKAGFDIVNNAKWLQELYIAQSQL